MRYAFRIKRRRKKNMRRRQQGFIILLVLFMGFSFLTGQEFLAVSSAHAQTVFLETGWENGQPLGLENRVLYSKDVAGYFNSSSPPPECGRRPGERVHSGQYSLMIAGYSRADYSYCYYQVFDQPIRVVPGMKIGYWIYHSVGTPKISVDGHFNDGNSIRDFGGGVLKDQYEIRMHPAGRQDPMNEWYYVEVDLSPAAERTLEKILFGFDNGGDGFRGPYRAFVDDFRVFVDDAQPNCPNDPVPADRWKGEYFNNMNLSGAPVMVRDDGDGFVNFDWGGGSPNDSCVGVDRFSARWTRNVSFPAGNYSFTITADDGVRFWIDDQLKLDKWIDQAPTEYGVGPVYLSGSHALRVEYYENGGGAVARLSWVSSGPVPGDCQANVPSDRWKGEYFNNMTLNGSPIMVRDDGDGFLAFDWGEGSPSSSCGIGVDRFSARWTRTVNFPPGDYRFTVTADDGVRLYIDDQLKLDKWMDQAPTSYTVPVYLSGSHTLRMEYYENMIGAVAQLSWQATEVIPTLPVRVPVLQLAYFPRNPNNPQYIDPVETGWSNYTVAHMQAATQGMVDAAIPVISDATRFRGYKNPSAPCYLEYYVVDKREFFEKMPRGFCLGTNDNTHQPHYRPHYGQILRDLNICNYVDNLGVKEVWIYGYHSNYIVPDESKMSSRYGDVSNALPKDEYIPEEYRLPRCQNSYAMYNFTYQPGGRDTIGNTIHNRLHQLENVIFYAENQGYPPNDYNTRGSIFWDDFSVYGNAAAKPGYRSSCGNTHSPPNVINEGYNYWSRQYRENNCETWHPDDSQTTYVNANCEQWGCSDVGFYKWFMQNAPGYNNGMVYQGKQMRNWWEAMRDFNRFIDERRSLWAPVE